MADARTTLLATLIDEVAAHGLTDRSLRHLAAATGTSHRMLLYHFGSRDGLVAAIVAEIEQRQRTMMEELAAEADNATQLTRALWTRVSSPELRPFVRLFYESLASTADSTAPSAAWVDAGAVVADKLGSPVEEAQLRLAVAVVRGLLIDVLSTGDTTGATASLERFLAMWNTTALSIDALISVVAQAIGGGPVAEGSRG